MKAHSLRVLALVSIPALTAACADMESGPTGPQVKIDVAALTLPGITEACFGITVFNGVPGVLGTDTVWTNTNVCSGQYGNGEGDITYIGPCDASVTGNNYIRLVMNSLSAGSLLSATGSPPDYVNPCPLAGGCVLNFECEENADVLVEFNLTVMRNAQQGFFDIVVNFEDIFCSAKFDSCYDVVAGGPATFLREGTSYFVYTIRSSRFAYARWEAEVPGAAGSWALYELAGSAWNRLGDFAGVFGPPPGKLDEWNLVTSAGTATGRPITLLHGEDGREHTAVAAIACTAGAGETTDILLSAPSVRCNDGGVSFTLNLAAADGGNETTSVIVGSTTYTLDYATYFGAEQLLCDGLPCGKVYYNIAFNLQALDDQDLTGCKLYYGATAVEKPATYNASTTFNAFGRLSDTNGVYPAISFGGNNGIPMTAAITGAPLCFAHGLNNTGSSVVTGYLQGSAFSGGGESPAANFHSNGTQAVSFLLP